MTATAHAPQTYRRSAVEASACLFRYQAIYVDGVHDESDPSRRGTAFHLAAEKYIDALIRAKLTSDAELAAWAVRAAIVECLLPGHLVPDVRALFLRWAERFELELDAVLQVEWATITTHKGRSFSWKPDLVYATDDGVLIHDWKTHYAAWSEIEARQMFQSRFYLAMARREWPGQPRYRLRYVFPRLNTFVEVSFDEAELDAIEHEIEARLAVVDEAHARGEYPATPGPHCGWCRLSCPIAEDADGMIPARIDDAPMFSALAAEYLAMKQRLTQTQKALRAYVVANGPTDVHETRIAVTPRVSVRYPAHHVKAVAEAHNIVLPDLTVSKRDIASVLRVPGVAAELDPVAIKKTSYVFTATEAVDESPFGDEPEA